MSGDQLLNAKIKSTCVFFKQNKEKPTMHEDDSPQLDPATALEIGINPKTSSPSTLLRSYPFPTLSKMVEEPSHYKVNFG